MPDDGRYRKYECEFSFLHVLLSNAGNVVSIEELFHAVWKDEYYSKNSSTITVHIRHLRRDVCSSDLGSVGGLLEKRKLRRLYILLRNGCHVVY